MNDTFPGLFVALEGGEGAGKSSVINLLSDKIEQRLPNQEIVLTREPGNSSIGVDIRNILLHNDEKVHPVTEALLFAAERAQHVHEVIAPALARGALVICDRFTYSSVAYQGVARGLGSEEILAISHFATQGIQAERTYILDVDPVVGLARKNDQKELNAMEEESLEFHTTVRNAFLDLANEPGALLINARESLESAAELCADDLLNILDNRPSF